MAFQKDLIGETALITGASGGLGAEFAKQLARRGCNVALAARSERPLQELADRLSSEHGVKATAHVVDLSEPGAARGLMSQLRARDIHLDILINNAGSGLRGEFATQSMAEISRMLQLNVVSLTELSHFAAESMTLDRKGKILLVSSVAAFQPVPGYAAYAASKAYVLSLGQSLHEELSGHGVRVATLCPGPADTNFFKAAGELDTQSMKRFMLSPEAVAAEGLRLLFGPSFMAVGVPGHLNRLATAFSKAAPDFVLRKLIRRALV